ncbi:putative MNORI-2 protein [Biscogniauxia mediterranea]|nr:putative MNORI-2 protein [Biscogniauxia mediterranea]
MAQLATDHRPPSQALTTTTTTTTTTFSPALPPILAYPSSSSSSSPPTLITQGAEARLYKTTYLAPSLPCALKYRPPKAWRHAALDARLTRQRILAEARVLCKCRREGVRVPAVYGVDEAAGWLAMEWVPGPAARARINELLGDSNNSSSSSGNPNHEEPETGEEEKEEKENDPELVDLLRRIARAVGGLHRVGVVHGDLTTSNMMVRQREKDEEEEEEIVIIDFGLASQSASDEDRAVDLYVLERAFASTHPRAEALFARVLEAEYARAFRQAPLVLRKLEEVRLRGRKRSMLG